MAEAGEAQEPPGGGRLNQAIANAVVHVYRARVGRGPTMANAFFRGNVVVVVLHDPFTIAERSLLADANHAAVRQVRRELERTMRDALAEAVGAATGCRIDAVMSDIHIDPDVSVEVFLLDRPVRRQTAPGASPTGSDLATDPS
jgi:uncharacterized protein YbcI